MGRSLGLLQAARNAPCWRSVLQEKVRCANIDRGQTTRHRPKLLSPAAEPPGCEAHERSTAGRSDPDPFQRIRVSHQPFVRFSEGVWDSVPARCPLL